MQATLARLMRLVIDLPHESDGRLLDRFLAGSEPAFRELVIRHGPLVLSVCSRILRHRQDAEDAFQAVFLVLARRAADVWPRDAVGAWLYGVAYRVAQKARAIRARRMQAANDRFRMSRGPKAIEASPTQRRSSTGLFASCRRSIALQWSPAIWKGCREKTLPVSWAGAKARSPAVSREPGGSWRIGSAKPGVTLPAGGLVTLLGTNASVRAELAEMVIGLGTEAIGVPTSVAALVEGAVQTMFISKLKTVAIAMLVVCAMGYGAWAGVGEGGGPPQVSNATQQPRKLVRNAPANTSPTNMPIAPRSPAGPMAHRVPHGRW